MAAAGSGSPTTPTIKFAEPFVRVANGSDEIDPILDDKDHAQDWSVTTDPKDSWAYKERRRSTVWTKIDDVDLSTNRPKTRTGSNGQERRGSILSVWAAGKDSKGRDVLGHDFHDEENAIVEPEQIEKKRAESPHEVAKMRHRASNAGSERQGSILSLWSEGKDEHGKSVVLHDDEEWKV